MLTKKLTLRERPGLRPAWIWYASKQWRDALGAEFLCTQYTRRYVNIPAWCTEVWLVLTKTCSDEHWDDSFEFTKYGQLVDHPGLCLMPALVQFLKNASARGYRYVRVEY